MDKALVVEAFLLHFQAKLEAQQNSKREAIFASEEAPSRNEARYDSSKDDYARMAAAIDATLIALQLTITALEALRISPTTATLFQVSEKGSSKWYFLSTLPAGEIVTVDSQEVMSLTGNSPLGQLLESATIGQELELNGQKRQVLSMV